MGKFEKGKRPTQAQSYAEPQRAPKKKKQKKQSRLGLIVALLAAAVVLVGCGVGYMFLRDDGRIVNNLYVAGVDLSGMTKEEARAALEKGVSVYGKENMNVALYTRPYDTFTSTYDPAQIPLVDIFGKPLDASAQTEATEPTETAPSETEPVTEAPTEAPTEEPTEDPNTPRDEDGKPMTLLTKLCLTPSDTAVRLEIFIYSVMKNRDQVFYIISFIGDQRTNSKSLAKKHFIFFRKFHASEISLIFHSIIHRSPSCSRISINCFT